MNLGELDLDQAAQKVAGNWRDFHCFVWFRKKELDDADQWAIIYTHHRDSGLLDESNAEAIQQELEPFTEDDNPDVVFESHHHWAVGHIDGFSIRVFKDGQITEAFKKYHELTVRLADYPVLDEEDYSYRETEATLKNIEDAAWRLKHDFDLPDDWVNQVYSWLSDHRSGEIENCDDQGGYARQEKIDWRDLVRSQLEQIGSAATVQPENTQDFERSCLEQVLKAHPDSAKDQVDAWCRATSKSRPTFYRLLKEYRQSNRDS